MKPIITDAETGRELWRATDCANYLNITIGTWSSYVNRKQSPGPAGRLDRRAPLWDAEEVKAWAAARKNPRNLHNN